MSFGHSGVDDLTKQTDVLHKPSFSEKVKRFFQSDRPRYILAYVPEMHNNPETIELFEIAGETLLTSGQLEIIIPFWNYKEFNPLFKPEWGVLGNYMDPYKIPLRWRVNNCKKNKETKHWYQVVPISKDEEQYNFVTFPTPEIAKHYKDRLIRMLKEKKDYRNAGVVLFDFEKSDSSNKEVCKSLLTNYERRSTKK